MSPSLCCRLDIYIFFKYEYDEASSFLFHDSDLNFGVRRYQQANATCPVPQASCFCVLSFTHVVAFGWGHRLDVRYDYVRHDVETIDRISYHSGAYVVCLASPYELLARSRFLGGLHGLGCTQLRKRREGGQEGGIRGPRDRERERESRPSPVAATPNLTPNDPLPNPKPPGTCAQPAGLHQSPRLPCLDASCHSWFY